MPVSAVDELLSELLDSDLCFGATGFGVASSRIGAGSDVHLETATDFRQERSCCSSSSVLLWTMLGQLVRGEKLPSHSKAYLSW